MAEVVKAHCNKCLRETNHELYAKKQVSWAGDDMQGQESYEIVICRGCDTVRFRQVSTGSEIYDEHGNFGEDVSYFPSAVSRQKPTWLGGTSRFPFEQREIASLLNEVYAAIHEDLRVLAAIGIRTILDMVMTGKVGDVGPFQAKVSAFEKAGFISPEHGKFLLETIDAGSASAHRGFRPSEENLKLLLDISENLISSIYIFPDAVGEMSKNVPPRAPIKIKP